MIDSSLAQLIQGAVRDARHIVVMTHEKPDGDAVSSLLACGEMFCSISLAKVTLVCVDNVPDAFRFLERSSSIQRDFLGGDADLLVTLDCGDLHRTGFRQRIQALVHKGTPLLNVDHHPKNDLHRLAKWNMVDYNAASVTQMLYELCELWRIDITPRLATALFTGLYTDTGSFQHAVTTPEVMQIASQLLKCGARVKEVYRHLNQSRTVAMLKLWGTVLERMRVHPAGVAISVVTRKDLQQTDASEDDMAGIVGLLEAASDARVALLLAEMPGKTIKGSLRSNKSGVDVARIAKLFGGGGHAKAAGFTIPGTLRIDKTRWNIV